DLVAAGLLGRPGESPEPEVDGFATAPPSEPSPAATITAPATLAPIPGVASPRAAAASPPPAPSLQPIASSPVASTPGATAPAPVATPAALSPRVGAVPRASAPPVGAVPRASAPPVAPRFPHISPARPAPAAAPARALGTLADAYVASTSPGEADEVSTTAGPSVVRESTVEVVLTTVRPMIRQVLRWSVVGLLLGLLFAALLPLALRYRMFPVKSASMTPALHSGDLMLVRPVQANKVRIGDVVAMRDPSDGGIVPGRVRSLRTSAGSLHIQTQTDRTRSVRLWTVPASGSLEVVKYRVSKLGTVVSWLPSRANRWVPYGLPGVVFLL